jgi:hypothetical protein
VGDEVLGLRFPDPIDEPVEPLPRVLEGERWLDRLADGVEDDREVLALGDVDAHDARGLVDLELLFHVLE